MVSQTEIVSSLAKLNGTFFTIQNLHDYARKVTTLGKSIFIRNEDTGQLISYVLYYDNQPEVFITMVWTHPEHRGQGFAKTLIQQLIRSTNKDITLELHKKNPAIKLYDSMKFKIINKSDEVHVMQYLKRIAIMQPYLFPYIGYFHLINASDLFVFYDDVNYIKRGWINRNRILINGEENFFTVPLSNASQNRLINEISLSPNYGWKKKFTKTLAHEYHKAPFFAPTMNIVNSVLSAQYSSISDFAIFSIISIYHYLGMELNHTKSSVCSPETKGTEKADRLIEITKRQGYKRYVNAAGGINLYSKDYFKDRGVEIGFVKSAPIEYKQFANKFVPWLSIIDVLMFNEKKAIRKFFTMFDVI